MAHTWTAAAALLLAGCAGEPQQTLRVVPPPAPMAVAPPARAAAPARHSIVAQPFPEHLILDGAAAVIAVDPPALHDLGLDAVWHATLEETLSLTAAQLEAAIGRPVTSVVSRVVVSAKPLMMGIVAAAQLDGLSPSAFVEALASLRSHAVAESFEGRAVLALDDDVLVMPLEEEGAVVMGNRMGLTSLIHPGASPFSDLPDAPEMRQMMPTMSQHGHARELVDLQGGAAVALGVDGSGLVGQDVMVEAVLQPTDDGFGLQVDVGPLNRGLLETTGVDSLREDLDRGVAKLLATPWLTPEQHALLAPLTLLRFSVTGDRAQLRLNVPRDPKVRPLLDEARRRMVVETEKTRLLAVAYDVASRIAGGDLSCVDSGPFPADVPERRFVALEPIEAPSAPRREGCVFPFEERTRFRRRLSSPRHALGPARGAPPLPAGSYELAAEADLGFGETTLITVVVEPRPNSGPEVSKGWSSLDAPTEAMPSSPSSPPSP